MSQTTLTETDLDGLHIEGKGTGTSYRISLYRARAGGLRLRIQRDSCWQGSPDRRVVTYPWAPADTVILNRASQDAQDAGTDPHQAIEAALYEQAQIIEHSQEGRTLVAGHIVR